MTNLHEGFDPEHFDEKTQVDVTSPRGTKYSDVAITYTATIIDGKPVVHPRSIVAKRTDVPVAFTKQMTEIVLQDQQALAAIQQHADQMWSERDNDYKGGNMSGGDNIAALMPKITARREELMNQGVEPEEALEQAAEELGVDPERVMDEFDLRNESTELSRIKELAGLSEGFDPEHFDAKAVSIKIKNERGHDIDCIVSYTATLIDGVPTVHPRSIVARPMTDKWGDREKYMTKMVLQDQEALAAIQKHAEEIWSERDNDYKSGDVLGSKYADKIAKVARGEFSTGDPNEYDGSGVTAGRHEKF